MVAALPESVQGEAGQSAAPRPEEEDDEGEEFDANAAGTAGDDDGGACEDDAAAHAGEPYGDDDDDNGQDAANVAGDGGDVDYNDDAEEGDGAYEPGSANGKGNKKAKGTAATTSVTRRRPSRKNTGRVNEENENDNAVSDQPQDITQETTAGTKRKRAATVTAASKKARTLAEKTLGTVLNAANGVDEETMDEDLSNLAQKVNHIRLRVFRLPVPCVRT